MKLDGVLPIFYFTGTGGSLYAARRIAEALPEYSIAPIAALVHEDEVVVDAGAVGFVVPLYYAGLPGVVERFIRKLRFTKPCYIFAVIPCGLPWSGYALNELKWMLGRKNQKLSAGFLLKMTDNFLPHFDMPGKEAQAATDAAVDEKLNAIIARLKSRERFVEHEKALLLYPSHPIYRARFKKNDRFFTAGDDCTACGTCARVCPVDNIEMVDGKPRWQHRCEFCLGCIQYCPVKTIQWKGITRKRGRYHYSGISAGEVARQKEIKPK